MKNPSASSTVLDVSQGLGYGMLYNPIIGQTLTTHYPLITRFRKPRLAQRLK